MEVVRAQCDVCWKSGSSMDEVNRIEAVKGVIAALFAAQRALRALAPDYKWAGTGNLLGDLGNSSQCRAMTWSSAAWFRWVRCQDG